MKMGFSMSDLRSNIRGGGCFIIHSKRGVILSNVPTGTTVLGWSLAISGSRPPNFFPRGWGFHFWGPKAQTFGFYEHFEYMKIFEKFRLENAIKMNLGDLLNKIF